MQCKLVEWQMITVIIILDLASVKQIISVPGGSGSGFQLHNTAARVLVSLPNSLLFLLEWPASQVSSFQVL